MNDAVKDIVPSVALCKEIPAGAFEDSAFVWYRAQTSGYYCCLPRLYKHVDAARTVAPAPTLEEILTALRKISAGLPTVFVQEHQFQILADTVPHQPEIRAHQSGATAALQTWLEITRKQAALKEVEA